MLGFAQKVPAAQKVGILHKKSVLPFRVMPNYPTDKTPTTHSLAPKPETALTPVADAEPAESHFTRWHKQAWFDFAAKLRQEQSVSGITGAIMLFVTIGLFIWGAAPLISLLPVALFVAVVLVYYALVFFRAPAKLDKERQAKIDALHAELEEARRLQDGATEGEVLRGELEAVRAERLATQQRLEEAKAEIAESKKHKVKFELAEVSTRVFVQTPSEGLMLIIGRIKLRFENLTSDDWSVKNVDLTLHKLGVPQEQLVYTFVVDDRYFGVNGTEIPRDSFEGMLIQAGRVD